MRKDLAKIQETETREFIRYNETIAALNELYLGFENLEVSDEDKEKILDDMKLKGKETEEELKRWWKDAIKKYSINIEKLDKLQIDIKSSTLFSEI